jgi:TfoX/Sxy family transcriptional regulator of competence genes
LTPEERYGDLVGKFAARRDVTSVQGKGFGSTGQLKVGGRIFAMLVRGELVVKLPREKVAKLVASGDGRYFDAGKGKPMREWFVLSPTSKQQWLAIAKQAMDFVGGKG